MTDARESEQADTGIGCLNGLTSILAALLQLIHL